MTILNGELPCWSESARVDWLYIIFFVEHTTFKLQQQAQAAMMRNSQEGVNERILVWWTGIFFSSISTPTEASSSLKKCCAYRDTWTSTQAGHTKPFFSMYSIAFHPSNTDRLEWMSGVGSFLPVGQQWFSGSSRLYPIHSWQLLSLPAKIAQYRLNIALGRSFSSVGGWARFPLLSWGFWSCLR